jgi:hypothetical protein
MTLKDKDKEHLQWIYDRLVNVYYDSHNTDYMRELQNIIDNIEVIPYKETGVALVQCPALEETDGLIPHQDFSSARVGDEVYCLRHGEGVIRGIRRESDYPIRVKYSPSVTVSYTIEGYIMASDVNPILFWDKPTVIAPKEPERLPELKVDQKVIVWDSPHNKYKRHFHSFDKNGKIRVYVTGGSSWNESMTASWLHYEVVEDTE